MCWTLFQGDNAGLRPQSKFFWVFLRLLRWFCVFTCMNTFSISQKSWPLRQPLAFLVLAAIVWFALYQMLNPGAEALVAAMPVDRNGHLGGAIQFFLYDTPKVLMLLTGVVFVMGMVNSYFTPERTRAMLAGRTEGVANVMAASLGVVTPFCSCSAVPLFIGFVQAGVPLGVTFSFLIFAPMVNEVALTLLFGMFGWKVALLYAHFSDRGRQFRRDRGRRFRAIVDAQGMRASEELNVSQGPERCPAGHREAWHQLSFNCSGSRRVPPLRAMRWLLCTMRSRMASARVGSSR